MPSKSLSRSESFSSTSQSGTDNVSNPGSGNNSTNNPLSTFALESGEANPHSLSLLANSFLQNAREGVHLC
jgi:hypothetical protein